jgi:hypothetical protein
MIAFAVYAALCLAHLGAGLGMSPATWGVHQLAFLPRVLWSAAAVVLGALAVPAVAGRVAGGTARAGAIVQRSPGLVLAVASAATALFYLVRLRFQFLGDGQLWEVKIGARDAFFHYEPLAVLSVQGVARLVNPAHPELAAGFSATQD